MPSSEILDLVDNDDHVIGSIERSEYSYDSISQGFLRGVALFILNDRGEVWIPTRALNKSVAPGCMDYSMGGHVQSGEEYIAAALRECSEELNLYLRPLDLTFRCVLPPGEIPYFIHLFTYATNRAPEYNREDYISASWLSPREVLLLLDQNAAAKKGLRAGIEYIVDTSL